MGSPFNLVIVCNDSAKAALLAKRSFALVDSFNHIFSDYDPSSELSRVSANAGNGKEQLSPAFWSIFSASQKAWQKSKGTFDISVAPLSHLWKKARKEKYFPDSNEVRSKKQLTGLDKIKTDPINHSIQLPVKGMQLDLGGIAKGYVAQAVIDFLYSHGIHSALADAGGDMAMSNAPTGTRGWTVGVNIPETTDDLLPKKLLLANRAVATSGDAYQFIEHNGRRYSHIIDPRTGYGISSQRNVTVIAKNGTDADWLATACSILPIGEAKQLAARMGAELMITTLENEKIIYHKTKGFDRYWKP